MRKLIVFSVVVSVALLIPNHVVSYNNIISGIIGTALDGSDELTITVSQTGGGIQYLRLKSFHYPSYEIDPVYQSIENLTFGYTPGITSFEDHSDADGNQYRYSFWGDPGVGSPQVGIGDYSLTNTFECWSSVELDGLRDTSVYPISVTLPADVQRYLQATSTIQSDNWEIQDFAQNLVSGSTREHEAVTRIMDWIRDNMTYEGGHPENALWIFQDPQHRGDCTGFALLPIAFLRSIGIPAKYVSATTIDSLFCVPKPGGSQSCYLWGRGTHAWFEVYYPQSGWIPYDGQLFYHFVNTFRYKRSEGLDEQHCATAASYSYWNPPPTISISYSSSTSVYDHICHLEFVDTLPTPQKFTISDKIIPLTGIEEELVENSRSPERFRLLQNYPNPFNPETIMEYALPEGPERVRLTIYNLLGQEVRTLVDEEKQAGTHRIHWDGTDDEGRRVASGIYFSRVKIGGFSEAKKMVLLK
jgi:hypothetical protein